MLFNKKMNVVAILTILVLAGIAASAPPKSEHQNLKVLPKNISHEDLDKVMHQWNNALGVRCNFCHAARKDDLSKMDFASDENKHKDVAREMFRMTLKLNKKYFDYKPKDTSSVADITCYSCHHGKTHPDKVPEPREGRGGGRGPGGPGGPGPEGKAPEAKATQGK